jgi:branched-chain amino acid transport system permease protein
VRRVDAVKVAKAVAVAGFVALVALLPLAIDDFEASQYAYVGIFFIAICGLNILTGYTGQISLGHGAFMAVGGYVTAVLATEQERGLLGFSFTAGIPYYATIPIAGVVAAAVGFVLAIPALRLSGLYLALATFGIALATPVLIRKYPDLSGGSTGLSFDLVGAPSWLRLSTNDWFYYLCWTIALVLLAAAWLLLRGRTGRAFRAVRDSEVAAVSFGVHLPTYKTLAFAVSAFYAGVAGALFAVVNLSYVSPETFALALSIYLVVGTVAAGLGSLWGIVFGALLLEWLRDPKFEVLWVSRTDTVSGLDRVLPVDLDPTATGIPDFVLGAVLVAVMLLLPTGAAGLLRKGATALSGRLYTRAGSAQ